MRIELSPAAHRQITKLPPKIYDVVVAAIDGPITENPYRSSKPLSLNLDGMRSVRRGDFRILLRIDDAAETVYIERIEHRSTAYRPR